MSDGHLRTRDPAVSVSTGSARNVRCAFRPSTERVGGGGGGRGQKSRIYLLGRATAGLGIWYSGVSNVVLRCT